MPDQFSDYLPIGDAAEYIGVSKQTLRRWEETGKLLPVRHPANDFRYYKRADLEPFRLEYQRAETLASSIGTFFQKTIADVEGNALLREPQREAHREVREHFASNTNPVIIQIPVGCGKTGIVATLPFGVSKGRVLVIAPNTTIRKGIVDALDISDPSSFFKKTKVLTNFADGPFTAVLDGPAANLHDCNESHFVVTNIQQLASMADRWLPQFPPNYFDLILVDEGHHNAAPSWRKVFEKFPHAKVVSLTATPFRSDRQQLTGDVIYRYSYARAMLKGYIKQVVADSAAPSEIYFTYKDDVQKHTLAEVMELREEQWFRRGVALSPECNRTIVDHSIQRVQELRKQTGVKHQIIAVACSIDHARQVRALYEQRGMVAREIYSEMDEEKQDRAIEELRSGKLDCIVQVLMLGEGFDHPPLSVAAVFRPFRSLPPYIQFIGRVMRVIHDSKPNHPDNQAFVVSHVGLNNEALWHEFRELDLDDQALFHKLLDFEEVPEESGSGGGGPRRFDQLMLVGTEVLSHFINDPFLDPEDDRVLDRILDMELPGGIKVGQITTRDVLREQLRDRKRQFATPHEVIPVSPQRRRQTARKRVDERSKSVANRVLSELGFSAAGFDIAKLTKGTAGLRNRAALIALLNLAINDYLGIKKNQRNTTTADQMEGVYDKLDTLGDQVRETIRKSQNASTT